MRQTYHPVQQEEHVKTETQRPHALDTRGEFLSRSLDAVSSCWAWVWTRNRRKREEKIKQAIVICEESKERFEAQRTVAEQKLDEVGVSLKQAVTEKNHVDGRRLLRRKKTLQEAARKLEAYVFDMENKILILSEMLSNQDVLEVVKTVGKAMSGVPIDEALRDAESATETMDEQTEAAAEFSEYMTHSVTNNPFQNDEELLEEFEELLGNNGPPPHNATENRMPVAPSGAILIPESAPLPLLA